MDNNISENMQNFSLKMEKKFKLKSKQLSSLERAQNSTVTNKKRDNNINIDLEHKAKKFFNKLNLKFDKIPTLTHDEGLAENVEGIYGQEKLSVRKNPRVSDKKAEAVVMHEIYHHIQKDRGLSLEEEEAGAKKIEEAYLNENPEPNNTLDFDLIYAHTIQKFYEMNELERLVNIFGGDGQSARVLYSNAMQIISENS